MDVVGILLTVLVVVVICLAISYVSGPKVMALDGEARRILMLVVGAIAILYLVLMLVGYMPALRINRLH